VEERDNPSIAGLAYMSVLPSKEGGTDCFL